MFALAPGDVLSCSAGSTQTGPEGFRKLRARPGLLQAALKRWPELAAPLGGRTPMFINAYPASIGMIPAGISVDTYLSPRVMSRALQLAAAADQPGILCGQSLLLADALLDHVRAGRALPDDRAARSGKGWAIWNHRRLHPSVHRALEAWTDADWQRRTGYVRRDGATLWIQLRQGESPSAQGELDHWDFARAFGFSWLDKPCWR